jgi:hypothetical protein
MNRTQVYIHDLICIIGLGVFRTMDQDVHGETKRKFFSAFVFVHFEKYLWGSQETGSAASLVFADYSTMVARFFLVQAYQKRGKTYQMTTNYTKQAITYTKWP